MPARREGGVIAFFFDLDNLKRANDLLGHTVGSEVIQRFADLLAVTFRKTDVIGRVGGDEFVVLAPAPAESASEMLNRFARVVETLNRSEHLPLPISYSVGFAQLPPGDSGNLNRLIAQADARMYAEKSRKRAA
jgi:diguanylate cyclase (GGDEF)-like protein